MALVDTSQKKIQQINKTRGRQAQNNTAGHINRRDPEGGKPRTIQQAIKIGETQREASPEQYSRP